MKSPSYCIAGSLALILLWGCNDPKAQHASSTQDLENDSTADSVHSVEVEVPSIPVQANPSEPTEETAEVVSIESLSLEEQRQHRDETVWKKENLAQQYEGALVHLWDQLLAAQRQSDGDCFAVLANQPLDSIKLGQAAEQQEICWDAFVAPLNRNLKRYSPDEWKALLDSLRQQGYRIVQTEWHHAKFDIDKDGNTSSTVTMAIYGEHEQQQLRFVISGDLNVTWKPVDADQAIPIPEHIDGSNLKVYSRKGPAAFKEILTVDHATPKTRSGIQPVLVQDMNNDGLSEIILGGSNELIWNRGGGEFEIDRLCTFWERGFEVALIADINGDAINDYVTPGIAGDLLLYTGNSDGRFATKPKGKARGGGPLRTPQVMAAGDIDRDGDLDLWIGQYKISYSGGQMPTPYFDANDGFPAFLLVNNGKGHFTPQTEEAGIAKKRFRRSYGGSFVDLDRDGDLDLLVVSDFSGIDVYTNDGNGYFTDVTAEQVDERHLFGMAATFSDYNADGALDFFVTGMASTTARRLEYMRLGRRDRPEVHRMRSRMGYGNRMYMAHDSGFSQPDFRNDVARTGWTWGATSLDFDNDGFPDIFVANGHSSGKSTKDHCSHFWCHDIYDATSEPNKEMHALFNSVMKGYYDRSESWDGYQKNQLLVNLEGQAFVNLGFLMGVGHEYDGRAVISDDVDGDGRMDLIVAEDQWRDGQTLHVYRNQLETKNHWIAVQLVDTPGIDSPLGVNVVLTRNDGSKRIACVTAGDSIHAQHATTAHFGIGSDESVNAIELQLVSGKVLKLDNPAVDRYHRVEIE